MSQPDDTLGIVFDRSEIADSTLIRRHIVQPPNLEVEAGYLRADVLAAARRSWEDRTRAEYVGVMIVRRFHGVLVDLGAPMDLQELALVMQLQEQRHASLCAACARALGSDGEVAFELAELQQARGPDLEEELVAMVVGTFLIGEGVAHALLAHAIRACAGRDSGFRTALRRILADEVLHARLAAVLLPHLRRGSWLRWPGDALAEDVAVRTIRHMRGRDVVEPGDALLFEEPEAADQLRSLGIPPTRAFRATYDRALDRLERRRPWLTAPP